jgi:hypothetical protein
VYAETSAANAIQMSDLQRQWVAQERGSAPVEASFSMVIILLLLLGLIQVAFALYGRNVVAASAHEGARAAVELGRGPDDAVAVATRTVRQSASGLVDELAVRVWVRDRPAPPIVQVRVSGRLKSFGPIPLSIPVSTTATSTRELSVP